MIIFPPAKINLGLNVLEKRDDGYHEIETVMYPVPLCDILEVLPAEQFTFRSSGLEIPGEEKSNLCVKAFERMRQEYQIQPVYIHLIKNIPTGAGLGGGSSDASSVLLAINELFELQCSTAKLQSIAAELGSDCPFFITAEPQFASGRGEILKPINLSLSGKFLKLIAPDIPIQTAGAYSRVHLSHNPYIRGLIEKDPTQWKGQLMNSFEESVFEAYPEIGSMKEELYKEGAFYAAMSGSGSTVFGLFNEQPSTSGSSREWILKL